MTERTTHPGLVHRGRIAFVTGGGSGIGLETALTLADLGADVAVLDWTPGAAAAAAERIEQVGRRALAIEGDTGDEQTVVDAFAKTRRALGDIDAAIAHIRQFGSNHTDCIMTEDEAAAALFFERLDSAILMHNASTQFADGGEFGMGAEIGIATGKMHARGPVGAAQLTSFKYLVRGNGTTRS